MKYTSQIQVFSKGFPMNKITVAFAWNGWIDWAQAKPAQTDTKGVAILNHTRKGTCTLFLNGKPYGKYNSPMNLKIEL